jgi:hypothetical protein
VVALGVGVGVDVAHFELGEMRTRCRQCGDTEGTVRRMNV